MHLAVVTADAVGYTVQDVPPTYVNSTTWRCTHVLCYNGWYRCCCVFQWAPLCPVPQHDIAQLPTYVSTTIESGTTIASDYSRLPVHLSAAAITAKKRKPAAHLPSEQYIVQGHTQPSPVTNQRVCYTCYTCLMHQRVAFIGEGWLDQCTIVT